MDGWTREEYTRSEAERVQNRGVRRSTYKNGKKGINWDLADRDQSLDQDWVADEKNSYMFIRSKRASLGF